MSCEAGLSASIAEYDDAHFFVHQIYLHLKHLRTIPFLQRALRLCKWLGAAMEQQAKKGLRQGFGGVSGRLVEAQELVAGAFGNNWLPIRLQRVSRPIGQNNVGVIAWLMTLKTPESPSGRQVNPNKTLGLVHCLQDCVAAYPNTCIDCWLAEKQTGNADAWVRC